MNISMHGQRPVGRSGSHVAQEKHCLAAPERRAWNCTCWPALAGHKQALEDDLALPQAEVQVRRDADGAHHIRPIKRCAWVRENAR